MSALDRLRVGRYISPSGKQYAFEFEDLNRASGKKHSVSEIPESDNSIVQDLGVKSTTFSLKLYFSGDDYDQTADSFYAALSEHGPGILKHPRWGDIRVLAASWSQTEGFVSGIGEAIFEIDFVYAADIPYLTSTTQTGATLAASAAAARSKSSASFANGFGSPALKDLLACKDRLRKSLREIKRSLLTLTGSIAQVSQQINAQVSSIEGDIDTILATPALLGESLTGVFAAACSAPLSVSAKISSLGGILDSLGSSPPASAAEGAISVFTLSLLSASIAESTTSGPLSSRSEAIAARDSTSSLCADIIAAIERDEAASGYTLPPDDVANLVLLGSSASAYLLEASFSLRAERRVTLDSAATPFDLVYRFYGDLSRLDEFCDQNQLGGDSILIIPAGTEVRYYVG